MPKYLAIILLLCSIYPNLLAQNPINLDSDEEVADFQNYMFVLEDPSRKLTLEDIRNQAFDTLFRKSTAKGLNYGFNQSHFWIKFQLKQSFHERRDGIFVSPTHWFLENPYYASDSIELFYLKDDSLIGHSFVGDMVPLSQYEYPYSKMVFPLEINSLGIHTFYIKYSTQGSAQLTFQLKDSEDFERFEFGMQMFFGFFFGSMLIMLIYNLFLFTAIRSVTYLYYCLYIFTFILGQLSNTGYGYYFFWGEYTYFANLWSTIGVFISASVATLFTNNFLRLKYVLPFISGLMWYYILFIYCLLILAFFVPYNLHSQYMSIFIVFHSSLQFVLGLVTFIKGKRYALYYTVGWSFLILGVVMLTIKNMGFLPSYFIFNHLHQIGAVFEVLFLSIALADQINIYREDKEKAQASSLLATLENEKILAGQNKLLEEKVMERTQELQSKHAEIIAQYKELLIQKDEILEQHARIEQQNATLVAKDRRIEGSIKAAKIIQSAILPSELKLKNHLKDYFLINRPKDIVSGDFYWFDPLEEINILALADCTGHGVQGAFMTLIGNTLLDKIIRVWDIYDPAVILTRLNQELELVLNHEENPNNSNGMDMAVIVWKKKSEKEYELIFSGAKRPLYCLEPSKKPVLKELQGDRKSIGGGLQNESIVFTNQTLILEKGSRIYLFSDGFADQNNFDRKRLGDDLFKKALLEQATQPMWKQKEALENLLDDFMVNTNQRDDIMVLGFELG